MKSKNQGFKIVRYDPNLDEKHFSEFKEAYLKLFNERKNLQYLSLSNIPFNSDTVSNFLESASEEEVEYYVAISSDNKIIGISALKSNLIEGFEIIGTVVDKDYRFKGIGKALIDEGINIAKEKSFRAVNVSVFADNKSMLILLIKMDFKPVRIENHARYDGEDLVLFKKYL